MNKVLLAESSIPSYVLGCCRDFKMAVVSSCISKFCIIFILGLAFARVHVVFTMQFYIS